MSSPKLPESLRNKPMPTIDTMNIETSILDPTTISQTSCRFVLERKGILDVGSAVQFSVHTSAVADKKAWLPFRTGINALIERAVLRIGTRAVATSDEFGKYMTIKRQFKTNEEKQQKDLVMKGTTDGMEPNNNGTGFYQPANIDWSANAVGTVNQEFLLTYDQDDCPVWTIKLSELFPMMRNVMLPLFMIHQPVSIELTFKRQGTAEVDIGKICCFDSSITVGTDDTSVTIGTKNVKFLADYLTYTDSRMEETARLVMSPEGMVMPFEDLILTNTSVPGLVVDPVAGTVSSQSVVRELGLSGQVVRSIVGMEQKSLKNKFLGQYASSGFNVADAYNIRINDAVKYNRAVQRETYKQSQLAQVFSVDLNVLNCEYSTNQMTNKQVLDHPINNEMLAECTIGGQQVRGEFEGLSHYIGVDLTVSPYNVDGAGLRVGQKPITIERTIYRTATENEERQALYWAIVERMLTIRLSGVTVSSA